MPPSPDDPVEQPGAPDPPVDPSSATGPLDAPDAPDAPDASDASPDGTAPTVGWASPTPPAASPLLSSDPGAPLVGWQRPDAAPVDAPVAEHVLAGPWARLVAWFIDSILVSLPTTLLTIVVLDYPTLFRELFEQLSADPNATPVFAIPMTPAYLALVVVTLGAHALYFVGFWTSRGGATPGMRLLAMRVVDAQRGGAIPPGPAVKRWIGLGMWLSLLAVVPPLVSVAGLAQFGLQFILFLTVATDRRRQGVHDRYAGTVVVRRASSGDGAVAMGCVVLIALSIVSAIILWAALLSLVLPEMRDVLDDVQALR